MNRVVTVLLRPHWVFILPPLHLAGCILATVTGSWSTVWMAVMLSEYPAGFIIGAIQYVFGRPLFWFGVFGTVWWCWLSWQFFKYLSRPDYDADIRLAIRPALLLAIPLELANLYLAMQTGHVGLLANAGLAERLLGLQWLALHLPGLMLLLSMEKAGFSGIANFIVLIASGYFMTALLLFIVTLGVRRLR